MIVLTTKWYSVHQLSHLQHQSVPTTTTSKQPRKCQELISPLVRLSIITLSFPHFMIMSQLLINFHRARRHEGRRDSRPACRHWRYNFPPYSIPDRYLSTSTSTVTIKHKPDFSNRVRRRQSRPRRSWQTRRTQLRIGK